MDWPQKCLTRDGKLSLRWTWWTSRHIFICCQISVNICKTVQETHSYKASLIRKSIRPIKWQQQQWPWMTWKVIHWMHAFSNAIRQTVVQNCRRFQLTVWLHGSCALPELLVNSANHVIVMEIYKVSCKLYGLARNFARFSLTLRKICVIQSVSLHNVSKMTNFSCMQWRAQGDVKACRK